MGGWKTFVIVASLLCLCAPAGVMSKDAPVARRDKEPTVAGDGLATCSAKIRTAPEPSKLVQLAIKMKGPEPAALEAFNEFYDLMWPRVVRYASSKVGHHSAEDAAQKAFLKLWQVRANVRPEDVLGLLFQTANRKVIDGVRAGKGLRTLDPISDELSPIDLLEAPDSDPNEWVPTEQVADEHALRRLHFGTYRQFLFQHRRRIPELIEQLDQYAKRLRHFSNHETWLEEISRLRGRLVEKLSEDSEWEKRIERIPVPFQDFAHHALFFGLTDPELSVVFDLSLEQVALARYTAFKELGLLRELIESLPDIQAFVLIGIEYDEKKYSELAEEAGKGIGTIKSRIYAARQKLESSIVKNTLERRNSIEALFDELERSFRRYDLFLSGRPDVDSAWVSAQDGRLRTLRKLDALSSRKLKPVPEISVSGDPVFAAIIELRDQGFNLTSTCQELKARRIRTHNGSEVESSHIRKIMVNLGEYGETAPKLNHSAYETKAPRAPFRLGDVADQARSLLARDEKLAQDYLGRVIVQLNGEKHDFGTIANFLFLMKVPHPHRDTWTARSIYKLIAQVQARSLAYWKAANLNHPETLFAAARDLYSFGIGSDLMIEILKDQRVPTLSGKSDWGWKDVATLIRRALLEEFDAYPWRDKMNEDEVFQLPTLEAQILRLAYLGVAQSEIARRLDARGIPTRQGAASWDQTSVRAILLREQQKVRDEVFQNGQMNFESVVTRFDDAGISVEEIKEFVVKNRLIDVTPGLGPTIETQIRDLLIEHSERTRVQDNEALAG